MPKRVPVNTIILKRDGKNFVPPIGKPFDFTQDELNDITAVMPNAVRKIINEGGESENTATPTVSQEVKKSGRNQGRQAAQPTSADGGSGDTASASGEGSGDL